MFVLKQQWVKKWYWMGEYCELVDSIETRASKWLLSKMEGEGGSCLMNIGDTPDLGEGEGKGSLDTLILRFWRSHFDARTYTRILQKNAIFLGNSRLITKRPDFLFEIHLRVTTSLKRLFFFESKCYMTSATTSATHFN